MTRFARASGSKASNARTPESATSWQEMKQSIKNVTQSNESLEDNADSYTKTIINSTAKNKQDTKWSEFPYMDEDLKKSKKDKTIKNKQNTSEESTKKKHKKSKKKKTDNQSLEIEGDTNKTVEQPVDAVQTSKPKKAKKLKTQNQIETEDSLGTSDCKKPKKRKLHNDDDEGMIKPKQFKLAEKGKKPEQKKFNNKAPFKNDSKEYKRRKPDSRVEKVFINGNVIEIAYFDGFPIKKVDADRLHGLRKEMISKGLPRSEISKALKLERRKAEKALAREKKKVCFNCRQSGHILSECKQLQKESNADEFGTGICFKCGSTEHTHFECKVQRGDNFKFAQCFICKEQGHIARQCPDNNRGLYPKGGACKVCGDVTHLKKDCPKYQAEQEGQKIMVDTITNENIESLDNETTSKVNKKSQKAQKIIKF